MRCSLDTFVARLAFGIAALCLSACGGGRSVLDVVPEATVDATSGPLIPITSKILFSSNRDSGIYEAYIMEGDGSRPSRLTVGTNHTLVQDISPDGQTLLCLISTSGVLTLTTMDVDGANVRRLPTGPGSDANGSFSPDGSQILFQKDAGNASHVYVLDIGPGFGTSNPMPFRVTTVFNTGAAYPRYNHDGSRIVFVEGGEALWTVNPDGSSLVRVTSTLGYPHRQPRFNHDGTKICFMADRFGSYDVFVVNADGTDEVRLTTDPEHDDTPMFSGDGARVLFGSNRTGNREIFSVRVTGADLRNLTNSSNEDYAFSLTASGEQIVYTSAPTEDEADIFAMNVDGSGRTNLSNAPGYDIYPIAR